MKKSQRQAAILALLEKKCISTQEDLLAELKSMGFDTTQATVSRDIRELGIIKKAYGGGYRYSVPSASAEGDLAVKHKTIFTEAVCNVDCACNLVVLKTYPGMGSAAGAAVDSMGLDGVVGTLSGDDTMLIVARTYEDAERIGEALSALLK